MKLVLAGLFGIATITFLFAGATGLLGVSDPAKVHSQQSQAAIKKTSFENPLNADATPRSSYKQAPKNSSKKVDLPPNTKGRSLRKKSNAEMAQTRVSEHVQNIRERIGEMSRPQGPPQR